MLLCDGLKDGLCTTYTCCPGCQTELDDYQTCLEANAAGQLATLTGCGELCSAGQEKTNANEGRYTSDTRAKDMIAGTLAAGILFMLV